MKVEYLTSSIVRVYFNFIIVNLTSMSFTINLMSEYTAVVSCKFGSVSNLQSLLSHKLFTYCDHHWLYPTNYINNILKTTHRSKLLVITW